MIIAMQVRLSSPSRLLVQRIALIQISGKMIVFDKLLGRMRDGGSCVLILSQMALALVILEDYCLFKQYNESFVIPFVIPSSSFHRYRLQKLTPTLPCRVSPYRVEALRTKAISQRLTGILMYVL